MAEEIAIAKSDRQRVRRAVRDATERQPRGIDANAREEMLQCRVDERDVRSQPAAHDIPRHTPRSGANDDDAEFVSELEGGGSGRHTACGSAGAMQKHQERQRPVAARRGM